MRRKLPSTAALAAFESAARHESFTLAASELALTQSAVGRQIANLEALVGVKMFRRTRRGVALTPTGLHYSRLVRARLDEVERDTLSVMAGGAAGGAIELAVVPTFATHWLVPRLPSFRAAHPGVAVHLHVHTRPFLFADTNLDAAIQATAGGWPGTRADKLVDETMVVICSPRLWPRRRRPAPKDIAKLPLIQMTTRPHAWRQWFAAQGIEGAGDMKGDRMELFSMATQAALSGLGAALVPEFFAAREIAAGELVTSAATAPFDSGLAYFLVQPEGDARSPAFGVFREWLLAQAESSDSSP
ncbi:LysR family transcriptional regulator [Ramlibacter sp.]|uniref:LysR family transcriptional regulator n=1 Tax=Ramlibacter sp. TaxID=1917967 RepID=UPI003D134A18